LRIAKFISIVVILIFSSLEQQVAWCRFDHLRPRAHKEAQTEDRYFIKNKQGQRLAVLINFPDREFDDTKRPVVFLMHGLAEFKTVPHLEAFAERFVGEGYIVVRTDFTNNGREDKEKGKNKSEGSVADYSIEGGIDDLEYVVQDLRERWSHRIDFSNSIVAGYCFGGLIAREISSSGRRGAFSDLGIRAVIDMSGVVSPKGTAKIFLRLAMARKHLEKNDIDKAYKMWRNAGDDGRDFGMVCAGVKGQRCYTKGWEEEYNAASILRGIPGETAYILISGDRDTLVRYRRGTPEREEFEGFLAKVKGRDRSVVLSYEMGHTYSPRSLPTIIDDVFVQLHRLLSDKPVFQLSSAEQPDETAKRALEAI